MNMDTIKIIFLKKKLKGGFITYQNNLLHLFSSSPAFDLNVIDEEPKIRSDFINAVYRSIQSTPLINILFNYIYIMSRAMRYKKDACYLYIPHTFKYGFLAVLMSSLFKLPFIVPLGGWTEKELILRGVPKVELFLQLKYEKWVLRNARYVMTSPDLANGYGKVIKNRNKFLYAGLPIDTNKFKPMRESEDLRNKLKLEGKKIILTAAPLEGVKGDGVKKLVEAFSHVKRECNNVILLVAGDGNQKKEIENVAESLNVEDVMFLEHRDDMPELINLCDVFALIFEFGGGLGAAIKEAMACEKPCVISRTSGTEILRDREEVLLSLDSKDIADNIILLLKDEEYARKIGINARKRIEAEFSIEKVGEKIFNKLSEDISP